MLTFLRRQAMLRGIVGGRRSWTMLWMLMTAVGLLRRLTRSGPEVVYREELGPGEALVIRAEERPPR